MKLKLEISQSDRDAIRAVMTQAQGDADVMISGGHAGGQMKRGYQIEKGIAALNELLRLAEKP